MYNPMQPSKNIVPFSIAIAILFAGVTIDALVEYTTLWPWLIGMILAILVACHKYLPFVILKRSSLKSSEKSVCENEKPLDLSLWTDRNLCIEMILPTRCDLICPLDKIQIAHLVRFKLPTWADSSWVCVLHLCFCSNACVL